MTILDNPNQPSPALLHLLAKAKMPTDLSSAELKQLDAAIRRQSLFSARTTDEYYLDQIHAVIESLVNPKTEQRPDRVTAENPQGNVTTGMNPAKAREALREALKHIGYTPESGDAGTIKDLSSDERLKLVIRTNVEIVQGAGRFVQQNSDPEVVDAYPGLSFERTAIPKGGEDAERDWAERWLAAADEADDDDARRVFEETGEMIALKSSDIWQALGDGAGGYEDTLGNRFDPIAFNTYMRQFEQPRARMEELGFLDKGEAAEPAPFDLGSLFKEAA